MVIERFAPSPTGLLHLGHAYSAWCGWTAAQEADGTFLLRMEDLDAELFAAIGDLQGRLNQETQNRQEASVMA